MIQKFMLKKKKKKSSPKNQFNNLNNPWNDNHFFKIIVRLIKNKEPKILKVKLFYVTLYLDIDFYILCQRFLNK